VQYKVVYIADDELPEGFDFAVARFSDGGMCAYLKRSAISPGMLKRAWELAVACQLAGASRQPALTRVSQQRPALLAAAGA
jgi:hypothetical protein